MSDQTFPQNLSTTERAISAGLGGFALARYGGRSLFGTLLAAALIHRAATGRCSVYRSLGVDTKDPTTPTFSRPSVFLSKAVIIRATPEQIYPFFTSRLEELAALSPEVLSILQLGQSTSRWTVKTPVGRHTFESRVVEREENRRLGWDCQEKLFPHSGQITLRPGPRGTTVRVSITYQPPGGALAAHLSRITGTEPHEALERALYNLQSLLETGEVPIAMPQNGKAGKEILA